MTTGTRHSDPSPPAHPLPTQPPHAPPQKVSNNDNSVQEPDVLEALWAGHPHQCDDGGSLDMAEVSRRKDETEACRARLTGLDEAHKAEVGAGGGGDGGGAPAPLCLCLFSFIFIFLSLMVYNVVCWKKTKKKSYK